MANLAGKIVLVTGSTDGVGRMVARRWPQAGATSRPWARRRPRPRRGRRDPGRRRQRPFIAADFSDLGAVRALGGGRAARRRARPAGQQCRDRRGGPARERQTNAAGHELRFAVNYLAGFLLTMPSAAAAAGERAGAHRQRCLGRPAGDRFRRRHADPRLFRRPRLLQSKLAQIMFTFDLAERLAGDRRHRQLPASGDLHGHDDGPRGGREALEHRRAGRARILDLATSPALEGRSGLYFDGLGNRAPTPKPTTRTRASGCGRSASNSPTSPRFPIDPLSRSQIHDQSIRTCRHHRRNSGIGLATARRLVADGMKVTVAGRNERRIAAAREALAGKAEVVALDGAEPRQVREFFRRLGAFDHLVLAMGSGRGMGPFAALDLAEVRRGFEEKVLPHFSCAQAALPTIREDGRSPSSPRCPRRWRRREPSGSLRRTARSRRRADPRRRIEPAAGQRRLAGRRRHALVGFHGGRAAPSGVRRFAGKTPVGRVGPPDDIAKAIAFLVANSFVSGHVLVCDGGLRLAA